MMRLNPKTVRKMTLEGGVEDEGLIVVEEDEVHVAAAVEGEGFEFYSMCVIFVKYSRPLMKFEY